MNPVEIRRGTSPVILGLPHTGTWVPDEIASNFNAEGRRLRDADWHVHTLYDGLLADASTVRATFHRYVIDANRDPSGVSLYPGQNTTGLVPLTDFDANPIWRAGTEPTGAEIAERVARFHRPYHAALEAEIERVLELHGVAILYDCHSIRSVVPNLFDGVLPDFNIGTDNGATCAPQIERAVEAICLNAQGFSSVSNGRFRGGWTTRHHGRPQRGVHAIQMELAQSTHLADGWPPVLDGDRCARLRPHLAEILQALAALAPELAAARA